MNNQKFDVSKSQIKSIFNIFEQGHSLENTFYFLMPALGEFYQSDRCFLYLRNPKNKIGKITHCWIRDTSITNMIDRTWNKEPDDLTDNDPMFRAATLCKPSLFIEDVESESPEILNKIFEKNNFGHRALIHSHLCVENELWGVLQPCIYGKTHTWSEEHRLLTKEIEPVLSPLAKQYINLANV